jgi:hypothetical protein
MQYVGGFPPLRMQSSRRNLGLSDAHEWLLRDSCSIDIPIYSKFEYNFLSSAVDDEPWHNIEEADQS